MKHQVSTIFEIEKQGYQVSGIGQETVKEAKKQFPNVRIILKGFKIPVTDNKNNHLKDKNGDYMFETIPVDLTRSSDFN